MKSTTRWKGCNIDMVLTKTKGQIRETAGIAGIHTRALYNKMKRLGLKKEDYKEKRKTF
jgi:DNA-binding NtrC family response regulator